jgi:hypothetical protein
MFGAGVVAKLIGITMAEEPVVAVVVLVLEFDVVKVIALVLIRTRARYVWPI